MKQIQDEYQSFMEGVRGRAQGAIDQANALFQAYRGDATSQLDAAIHYLQSRFFSFSVSAPPVLCSDWFCCLLFQGNSFLGSHISCCAVMNQG